jgi:hypothetical protein
MANVATGLWLAAVAAQALAHLTKYGLLPLPQWVARIDFTPQYYVLVALLLAAAVALRLPQSEPDAAGRRPKK